jgi:hypothetical protein
MKKNRWFLRMLSLLMICGVLNVTAAMAVEVGSSDDPLVTLSYLEEVFLKEVLNKVDKEIDQRNKDIVKELGGQVTGTEGGSVSTFTVVTLTNGQVLTGDIGCEVMLRVGSAVCVAPSAPGLINETDGKVLNNGGALVTNHLYMMTVEGRGVHATAATTKVLVRGTYTIA